MAPRKDVWLALVAGVVLGAACSVKLGDDLKYSCAADKDCGGDGWVCTKIAKLAYCCKPTGQETCNGKDDDCDGTVDDGFDLKNDSLNCGACGTLCTSSQTCTNGKCIIQATNCNDGLDHCADPGCNLVSCGDGCMCKGGKKSEESCNDGADNDGDGKKDCADEDCTGLSCGDGCACKAGQKAEAACGNKKDDDHDLLFDCQDPDCVGVTTDGGITCGADAGVIETTCGDWEDNDGDGQADCLDLDCDLKPCLTYAGFDWQCNAGTCNCHGGQGFQENSRTYCSDGIDNDCNAKTDCADPNCFNAPCALEDGGTGTCTNNLCQ